MVVINPPLSQEELEEVEMLVDQHDEANSIMPTVVRGGKVESGGRSWAQGHESEGRNRGQGVESGGRSRLDRPTEEVDFGQIQEI